MQSRSAASSSRSAAEGVRLSGWLEKQSKWSLMRSFTRRWFVLNESALVYFDSPDHDCPRDAISLASIETCVKVKAPGSARRAARSFEVEMQNRAQSATGHTRYTLIADTVADRDRWVDCIEAARIHVITRGRLPPDANDAELQKPGALVGYVVDVHGAQGIAQRAQVIGLCRSCTSKSSYVLRFTDGNERSVVLGRKQGGEVCLFVFVCVFVCVI